MQAPWTLNLPCVVLALAACAPAWALNAPTQYQELMGQETRYQSIGPGGEIWYRFVNPLTARFGNTTKWSFWTEEVPWEDEPGPGWDTNADTIITLYAVKTDGTLHQLARNDDDPLRSSWWSRIDMSLPPTTVEFFIRIEPYWSDYQEQHSTRLHRFHAYVDTQSGSEFLWRMAPHLRFTTYRTKDLHAFGVYGRDRMHSGRLDIYPYGQDTNDAWFVEVTEDSHWPSALRVRGDGSDYVGTSIWLVNAGVDRAIQVCPFQYEWNWYEEEKLAGEDYMLLINNYQGVDVDYTVSFGPEYPVSNG